MDRNTALWTLVAFFGASVVFGLLRGATEDSGTGVTLAVQIAGLLAIVGLIVVIVRRRGG